MKNKYIHTPAPELMEVRSRGGIPEYFEIILEIEREKNKSENTGKLIDARIRKKNQKKTKLDITCIDELMVRAHQICVRGRSVARAVWAEILKWEESMLKSQDSKTGKYFNKKKMERWCNVC